MIARRLMGVLKSRILFTLQTSIRLSIDCTLLIETEQSSNLKILLTQKVKLKKIKPRKGDTRKDAEKVPAKRLRAVSTFF